MQPAFVPSVARPWRQYELDVVSVSASFEILGLGRNPDGRGWGRFLRWRDADGRQHEKFVSDEGLQGDAPAICAPLAAEGLQIVRDRQREFANYLSGARTHSRVTVVHRTGWHEIENDRVFVLPGENISRKGVGRVLLDGMAHGPYETKGTLTEWRSGVAALASGHAIPMVAISAAFAGPLLHLAGLEGGGLNLFGQSSRGKTTCLQAAASVWGRGATPGYVRAWRATANGLEGAAAQSTDTFMVLDELGMVDSRDAAQALYGLANGQGKQRATRDGSAREPKSWRVLFLSSGELPVDASCPKHRAARRAPGNWCGCSTFQPTAARDLACSTNSSRILTAARLRSRSRWKRQRLMEPLGPNSCGG